MQNFCGNCGSKLKENAHFCASCGEPVASAPTQYVSHYEVNVPRPVTPPHTSFSCMLAYIPGLFWLPLMTGRKDNSHRECANQGLLLTLLTVLFGALTLYICGVLYRNGLFDFDRIKGLFMNFTATNWIQRLPEIVGWMGLTALVMYVPVNSMCGFFHGMGSDKPYRISIFGGLGLIRPRKNV